MKIELTMTELMLIVDMIKNGTEQDNEGDDSYVASDLSDDIKLKCTDCGSMDDVMFSTKDFSPYCKKCLSK